MRWLCLAVALTAPVTPGCKCARDGADPATTPSAAPAASAAPVRREVVLDELSQHATTLRLALRVSPFANGRLDPKVTLYELHLGAGSLPKPPPRVGPSLKPTAEAAQLTADEAKALLAWLHRPGSLDGVARFGAPSPSDRHASFVLGWDDEPSRYVVTLPWTAETAARFDAVRALLSDPHKPALETLSKPLPR